MAPAACGPLVDNAPFPVRPDSVRPGDLLGPYDGVVVDAETERPVAGATVAGSWAFERGIGLHGPIGSEEVVVETGPDGRYLIPHLQTLPSGLSARVRRFTLIVYHRGHVAWRSDRRFRGTGARQDFSQRGNRVRLERWGSADLHHRHLTFLGGGMKVRAAAAWEVQPAALELDGQRGRAAGARGGPGAAGGPAGAERAGILDVSRLLSEEEVRGVTGYVGELETGKLPDLPSTEFYDSRHFKAKGKPESYDVALRVWLLGPAAADAQYRKLLAELPGATATDEIGDASLRAKSDVDAGVVLGLAFLSRERGVVVALTCGEAQCAEAEALLKLAKLVEGKLGELPAVQPPPPAPPPPAPSPPPAALPPGGRSP